MVSSAVLFYHILKVSFVSSERYSLHILLQCVFVCTSDIERIRGEWRQRLGGDPVEVKVVTVTKASADGGLGVRLDGIQERDEQDVPQGYIHHVIQMVKPDGPVKQQGGLEVGDELLEVNGISLVNLSHEKAVQVGRHCVSVCLSVYLSVTLPVCHSTCLFVCQSVFLIFTSKPSLFSMLLLH